MYLNEATASGRKLHNKDIYKLHFPPDGSIFVSPGDIVNGKVGGGGFGRWTGKDLGSSCNGEIDSTSRHLAVAAAGERQLRYSGSQPTKAKTNFVINVAATPICLVLPDIIRMR